MNFFTKILPYVYGNVMTSDAARNILVPDETHNFGNAHLPIEALSATIPPETLQGRSLASRVKLGANHLRSYSWLLYD
jgi:hypothetical protein